MTKQERIVRAVWDNDASRRYVPRAYSSGGSGWGVWDKVESKYVEGDALLAIDPNEKGPVN